MKKINRRSMIGILAAAALVPMASGAAHSDGSGTVTGRVVDTEGNPVADALLILPLGVNQVSARSDSDGYYRIMNAPPGEWYLRCEHEEATSLGIVRDNVTRYDSARVIVRMGQTTAAPDVAMRRWTTVKLKVRFAGNTVAANQTFYLVELAMGGCFSSSGGSVRPLRTDANGVCKLSVDLGTGPITFLRFAHEETGQFAVTPIAVQNAAARSVTVQLIEAAVFEGRVVDSDGHTPCPGQSAAAYIQEESATEECAALMRAVGACKEAAGEGKFDASDRMRMADDVLENAVLLGAFSVSSWELGTDQPGGLGGSNSGVMLRPGLSKVWDKSGKSYGVRSGGMLTSTDADGNFRLVLFPGLQYRLDAFRTAAEAEVGGTVKKVILRARAGRTVKEIVVRWGKSPDGGIPGG